MHFTTSNYSVNLQGLKGDNLHFEIMDRDVGHTTYSRKTLTVL